MYCDVCTVMVAFIKGVTSPIMFALCRHHDKLIMRLSYGSKDLIAFFACAKLDRRIWWIIVGVFVS
jgi:hypothetical protein